MNTLSEVQVNLPSEVNGKTPAKEKPKIQTEVIVMSKEQQVETVSIALVPVLERLEAIEKRLLQDKLCYTAVEVAAMLSVSSRSVRAWIAEGKEDRYGKHHYLAAREMVKGRYSIDMAAVKEFMRHF